MSDWRGSSKTCSAEHWQACRYLRRCKTLHLLPPTMRLQAELAESPAALREQKVARFRESKRIRSKLGAAGSGRQVLTALTVLLSRCQCSPSIQILMPVSVQVADPCEIDDSGYAWPPDVCHTQFWQRQGTAIPDVSCCEY